jgi:hypothetical protein
LYLTPRNGRGLLPHVDTHDVFILQLHGAKHWRVGDPPEALPLADAKVVPDRWHNPRDYFLEAGDVLYLPRGFAHEAGTASTSSLHLTVGVYVHRWVDAMVEVLRGLADGDVELRAGLPVGFLDRPLDPAILATFAGRLSRELGDSAVTEAARTRLGAAMLTGGRATGGHFRSLDAIAELSGDSVVAPVAGVHSRVRSTAGEAVLEFDTNFVSGPLHLLPAFTFVAGRRRFCVNDLPDELSIRDKLDLVGRLVAEGYLTCIQDDDGGTFDGQRRNVDRAAR